MKRRTKLAASIGIAVILVAVIIYAATASVSGNFSSKVQCTESVVVVYATTLGGSSVVYSTVTTTVVESYSSIVNNSATINHTTTFTANTDHAIQVRLANASLISVSDQHLESRTYIK